MKAEPDAGGNDITQLKQLGIADTLRSLGVELASPNADKHEMTNATWALPKPITSYLKPGHLSYDLPQKSHVGKRLCTWFAQIYRSN